MQRRHRLTGDKRYSQIHRQGRSAANRLLVIRYLANGLEHSRFGFMVSKRVGNAVVRNKVRRRLREAVRANPVLGGWDAVFIARRGIEQAGFSQVRRSTDNLLRRARLLAGASGEQRSREPQSGGQPPTTPN